MRRGGRVRTTFTPFDALTQESQGGRRRRRVSPTQTLLEDANRDNSDDEEDEDSDEDDEDSAEEDEDDEDWQDAGDEVALEERVPPDPPDPDPPPVLPPLPPVSDPGEPEAPPQGGGGAGEGEYDDSVEARCRPTIPAPDPAAGRAPDGDGWNLMGQLGAWDSFLTIFPSLQEVPWQHEEAWVRAMAEVLSRVQAATTEGEKELALMWLLFLPQGLLRRPTRAQWTNTGLDPQISKFYGQEWTETDEEWGLVHDAPKIKSRDVPGKFRGKKKKNNLEKKKNLGTKKNKKVQKIIKNNTCFIL